jgi:hypothetical protein
MEKHRIRYPGWKKFGSGINIPVNTAFVFDYRTPYRDLFFVYCTPSYLRTGDSNLDVGKAFPGLSVSCAAQVPKGLRLVLWSTLLCCGEYISNNIGLITNITISKHYLS